MKMIARGPLCIVEETTVVVRSANEALRSRSDQRHTLKPTVRLSTILCTVIGPLGLLAGMLSSAPVAFAGSGDGPLMITTILLGQKSLLDLGDEDDEKSEGPSTGASVPPLGGGDTGPPPLSSQPPLPARNGPSQGPPTESSASDSETSDTVPVCDVVYAKWGRSSRSEGRNVKLLPRVVETPIPPARDFTFTVLTGTGQYTANPIVGRQITAIVYYEEKVLQRAAEEIGVAATQLASDNQVFDVFSEPEQAEAAERSIQIIETGIAEHNSAVQRLVRQGDPWHPFRDSLARSWFNLQMSRISHLIKTQQRNQALAACDRLREYSGLDFRFRSSYEPAIRKCLQQILLEPAAEAIDAERYAEARGLLDEFLRRYSEDSNANALRRRLVAIAEDITAQAIAKNDARLLDEAAAVWPQLQRLADVRREIVTTYPLLRCAYTSLPQRFSPLTARTVVERHSVSMIFESLVRWKRDSRIGPHYSTQLAEGRPLPLARGRQFRLPRCIWTESAEGVPNWCTRADVDWSLRLLKTVNPPAFPQAWEELVLDIDTSQVADAFDVSIMLDSDHWQPLSLMDFGIMPKSSFPNGGTEQEIAEFDRTPVGTGPYRLHSIDVGKEVRFTANPYYRVAGYPKISEIVFSRLDSITSHEEFLKGNVHLIYGVRPTQVVELQRQGKKVVAVPTPSVCFLSFNYQGVDKAFDNVNLRLALAHAIDRDAILKTCFRAGGAIQDHTPLNGPFPADSWAHNRKVKAFVPGSATTFLNLAKKEIPNLRPLRLIYPDDDPEVGLACAEIKKQWEEVLKLEITIDDQAPGVFYQMIDEGRYDLAYWRHDYRDETYWVWPWFDPDALGPGGSNFMGYVPDNALRGLFREMALHKQFPVIRKAAQGVHEYIARNAVIIPLWQLDTYVAASEALQNASFDPFNFYENVEQWELVAH